MQPVSSHAGGHRRLVALLAATLLAALLPLSERAAPASAAAPATGYWMVATDGGIFAYGDAAFRGSTGDVLLNQPIVGMASTPSGLGYWMVASDGGIFSFGDAAFRGSTGDIKLNKPIVGMASTPSGLGYWMVASDGGIFSFGDAAFRGSTGDIKLNKPIVGMASTPSGEGYWMVASDGGIFSFGDAAFHGSTGDIKLNQPIVGMASTPSGEGYWMTASDGGLFSFGDAKFHGAAPQRAPKRGTTRQVVAMVPTASGLGYWQVAASGELLAFGDAVDLGAPASVNRPVVGLAGVPAGAPATAPSNVPPGPGATAPGPAEPEAPPTTTTAPLPPPNFFSSQHTPSWGSGYTEKGRRAGRVLALAEIGDKVFIGGEQLTMIPPGAKPDEPGLTEVTRPFLAAIDSKTGQLLDSWDAQPNDAVLSLAASPDGKRLYVGGRFSSIGGQPMSKLAALDPETGQADPTFKPPKINASVRGIAFAGDKIFIGGSFEKVNDVERYVAALDHSGAVIEAWEAPKNRGGRFKGQTGEPTYDGMPGNVYDMTVTSDGKHLIVVGDFLRFGDSAGATILETETGKEISWEVDMMRPMFGTAAAPHDPNLFYVATGGTGGQVQAYRIGGSRKPMWVHKVDGDAMDVAATRDRLYLVGHYDFVLGNKTVCSSPPCEGSVEDGDTPNRHLSAFDAETGKHDLSFTAWMNNPQGPFVALIGKDHLYVGGDFTRVNDIRQNGFAIFQSDRSH